MEWINEISLIWANYFVYFTVQNSLFFVLILLLIFAFRKMEIKILYTLTFIAVIKSVIPPFLTVHTGKFGAIASFFEINEVFPCSGFLNHETAVQTASGLSITSFLMICWIVGLLYIIFCFCLSFLNFRRLYKNAEKIQIGEHKDYIKFDNIFVSGYAHSPLILGLINPRIILPATWKSWSENCRKSVLEHELAHITRKDHFINILLFTAQMLNYFNPLFWIINKKFNRFRELMCDEIAVKNSKISVTQYSGYLIDISRALSGNVNYKASVLMFSLKSNLENRILYLNNSNFNRNFSRKRHVFLTVVMCLMIIPFSFFCSVKTEIYNPSYGNKESVFNKRQMEAVDLLRQYELKRNLTEDEKLNLRSTEFIIPLNSQVIINVYSILGKLVRSYQPETVSQIKKIFTFDAKDNAGNNVKNGMYIVQAVWQDSSKAKKIIVVN